MATAPATNVNVTQIVKALRVTWTNSTTGGATHTVYRSRGACGAYVAVISGLTTASYTDYDVSNGETYAYKIVAIAGGVGSEDSNVVTIMYGGPADQYAATLTADGLTERRGALAVFTNVDGIPKGCGEYQRLQRLRGQATMCGK